MRLSNLADYAVVAMVRLASAPERMSAGALSEQTGIPAPTAAKLTATLTRAGLLDSTRGASGGAALSRPASDIRLTEIVEAVDGPIGLTQCLHDGAGDCAIGVSCNVRPHWTIINQKVRSAFDDVSLADLMKLEIKEPA
ncbi:SUF system Fe-S cluster assembly regulator [Pacificimonas sp. WHA3]|uniref:SUF system Fe-S cluster assembly regulator n=1 Tax=Pacificimonas pallii TaxID=2827236 RepID=A0ABS6SHJ0_9SPHN|nr:SUF system Fe-S cluster assembly regulator [Pacificimonas pallii]